MAKANVASARAAAHLEQLKIELHVLRRRLFERFEREAIAHGPSLASQTAGTGLVQGMHVVQLEDDTDVSGHDVEPPLYAATQR